MDNRIFDVAIVGAGPVGASLALGLARAGLQTAIIDARDPSASPKVDGRNFAIVSGSWNLLKSLGVTQALEADCEPLHGLEAIDGGAHFFGQPRVLFSDQDMQTADPEETLGFMVMATPLQAALDQAMADAPQLERLAPARFERATPGLGTIEVRLADGDTIRARLLVGADGMASPVRQAAGIPTEGRDYGKSVFAANVSLSKPHNGIARQLFLPEGPFATLPLKGNRANLAWYLKRGAAEYLAAGSKADAEAELNARFADFAGEMQIEGQAYAYPLILQVATRMTAPRTVLVGDAARRVNPLAGQGLNQGFRDVAALIEIIEAQVSAGLDPGAETTLERYSEARRFGGTGSALALDLIDRVFSNDNDVLKPLRGLGLMAAQRFGPLRRALAQRASATEGSVPSPMKGW
ncbi:MAG: FAD-dependent oxidoreductase [Pseudomonadota bacterium]